MSDLHTRLKTVIEERLALAKRLHDAEPGAWTVVTKGPNFWITDADGDYLAEVGTAEDAEFIAAHDPADAIRRHEAALRSIEIHHPFPHRTGPRCVHCQDGTEPWPCGEFEIVAGAYGLSIEVTP